MENVSDIKALFIAINAGFTDEIMEIARSAGAAGATIINARGEGLRHESFMGITVDSEREVILSVVDENTAKRIIAAIKEKAGMKSPIRGVCFVLPIDKMAGINLNLPLAEKNK